MAKKKKSKKSNSKKVSKKVVAKKKPAKKAKAVKKAAPKKAAKKNTKKLAKKKSPAKKAAPKKSAPIKAATKKISTPKPKTVAKTKPVVTTEHPWIGKSLPEFTLENQTGEHVNLGAITKSSPKVVLYFYPKDDTPGCTTEACGFRDNLNRAASAGIKVYGVSPDGIESHQKFIEKYGLNFDLLSDADHKLAEALDVWKEKNFMGKNYMGIERSTFLLHNGSVVKAWQPVKVEGHVDEVLQSAELLA